MVNFLKCGSHIPIPHSVVIRSKSLAPPLNDPLTRRPRDSRGGRRVVALYSQSKLSGQKIDNFYGSKSGVYHMLDTFFCVFCIFFEDLIFLGYHPPRRKVLTVDFTGQVRGAHKGCRNYNFMCIIQILISNWEFVVEEGLGFASHPKSHSFSGFTILGSCGHERP